MTAAIVHPDGRLLLNEREWRVAVGRAGVRVHKQEGDEATPAGTMALRRVLYRADRLPAPVCQVPREPLAPDDGWCDDPYDRAYNTQVRLPHDGRHERLWREDGLYDVIGVLGWNDAPVLRGAGSAIFLHIARPGLAPTEGCVAMALGDLLSLLEAGLSKITVLA